MRTRVKICGITRPIDAEAAARHGADAIGLVFYAPSPRYIDIETAKAIVARLPAFVSVVGMFVNATPQEIKKVLAAIAIDLIQFHGDETPAQCEAFGMPYIRAVRMHEDVILATVLEEYASARAVLVDSFSTVVRGGSGQVFDWTRIDPQLSQRVVLAGGLTPGNVAQAIATVQPYGVDVSGGVESAPGVKDPVKIAAFISEVNRVRQIQY